MTVKYDMNVLVVNKFKVNLKKIINNACYNY